MAHQVTNVSPTLLQDNLDTVVGGKRETFVLGSRRSVVLTDTQWGSRNIQRHLAHKRLRSKPV
jgi:hypothetical protein